MSGKLKVMLTTEGTYPFHQGGVSTWCDTIVQRLDDVDFVLFSIIMNPFVTQKFTLPADTKLIKVPLWGTEEPSEHLKTPFSQVYVAKKRTVDSVVREHFIPLFTGLIDEILKEEKDHKAFADIMLEIHRYLQDFEYKKSFKAEATWNAFKDFVINFSKDSKNRIAEPNVYSMIQALGWIYRFFNILNTPIPEVNVTHSAAAAFCGIPGVIAKLKYKSPLLLTEHGVYLREQYLSLSQRAYSSFLNTFLIRMIHSVSGLSYEYADQVSPVCMYNTRWEKMFGVNPSKIKVIYNGVDRNVFKPHAKSHKNKYPTVVTVARIDPIKDIITLLHAAAIVKERVPDVRFIVYGSVSVPGYYNECLEIKSKLGLDENFIFAGHTTDMPNAYRSGDIIVLASISEAFPYSVVEAMMVEKPVIATDVGGIREALGDAGIIVNPRQSKELAEEITRLIENPMLRETLGSEARERALNFFTIERFLSLYLKSYINLAAGQREIKIAPDKRKKQMLLFERGLALSAMGYYENAIVQLHQAAGEFPDSPAVPVILTAAADAYNNLGMYEHAFNELEKAHAIAAVLAGRTDSA